MNPRHLLILFGVSLLVFLAGCGQPVDSDGDGLNRTIEEQHGLDDSLIDTDADTLNDSLELHDSALNPATNDTDNDGLRDPRELDLETDPSNKDTDGDGAPDGAEDRVGGDPHVSDTDSDGISDGDELTAGTSLTHKDTDGDGLHDDSELTDDHLNPLYSDTDQDGLLDGDEKRLGTKPHRVDTDHDGRTDSLEMDEGTSPLNVDSDNDGLSDGVEAPQDGEKFSDPSVGDTDGDGLDDKTEHQAGTRPTKRDTDGDGRSDYTEYHADTLDPNVVEVRVIDGSPEAGLSNTSLQENALDVTEFLTELPKNKSKRDYLVTQSATEICDAHNTVASEVANSTSDVGQDTYRNTYRISHAAKVMSDLGSDIEPKVIEKRMETARSASSVAAKYAPVIGSYQRLHDASCAVKAGEPGAKEDFYIASAAFTVDLALVQQQVVYKAAFRTTGVVANKIGLMRLARVCGYKCVGLVESEMYWVASGTYSGAIDQVAIYAIEGNLTTDGLNATSRKEVEQYLAQKTGTRLIDGQLIPEQRVVDCVNSELSVGTLPQFLGELSSDALDILRTILTTQSLPEDADLSFLARIESVNRCIQH